MPGCEIIERQREDGTTPIIYEMIDKLVAQYHPDLAEAEILAVWGLDWKTTEEQPKLATIRKATPVERRRGKYDIVLTINHILWNHADFTDTQRLALIDEYLSYVSVIKDKDDEIKTDRNGLVQYRIRKPEFSGFYDVLNRYGMTSPMLHRLGKIYATLFARGQKPDFIGTPESVDGSQG